jgi:hypothetical protein
MDSQSMSRAFMSAGLWFGVSAGLGLAFGVPLNMVDMAVDSGLMGASSLVSDVVHSAVGMNPSGVSSAVATGAVYAGTQKLYRGSDAYMTNALLAGGNDWVIEMVQKNQRQSAMVEAMQEGTEEYDE